MNRVWFHYQDLEEYKRGMWKIVRGDDRKRNSTAAANLMRNCEAFKTAMYSAVRDWPNSCAFNLTSDAVNRIAWLGHAGCCIGAGSPEENTRIGWHMLNFDEQAKANAAALEVLNYWCEVNAQDEQLELFGCH